MFQTKNFTFQICVSLISLALLGHNANAMFDCNRIFRFFKSELTVQAKARELVSEYKKKNDTVQLDAVQNYLLIAAGSANKFALLERYFPSKRIFELIEDHEQRLYQLRLTAVLSKFSDTDEAALSTETQMQKFFADSLHNIVTEVSIAKRVDDLMNGDQSLNAIQRALGKIEKEELQMLVHGGDPLHPTPDSLLGQYISRTGASTVEYRFPTLPKDFHTDVYEHRGQNKLVVSLSHQSAEVYKELFTRPEFLIHHHTTKQGTLYIASNGLTGSYMRLDSIYAPANSSAGTLMPHILLPSLEANRMLLIAELGRLDYKYRESWQIPAYCPMGGYNSCTHWFGNLPIGRGLVTDAKHPGKVDTYAGNDVSNSPQIGPFKGYKSDAIANRYQGPKKISMKELLPLVWRNQGRGSNMGLAEMLGPQELAANLNGEYANPGWVALRLMGYVDNNTVPFVFRVTDDHTQVIDPNFDPEIAAY